MKNGYIADLELSTISILSGMPVNKDIINPKMPREMAERVKVTFRPLPSNYYEGNVKNYRESLINCLKDNGVDVVPWKDATSEEVTNGLISKLLSTRKVKRNINAVIDVKREHSPVRKLFTQVAEGIYRMVRNSERSVMDILKISGWADDFTARYVMDPFNTQIITLMTLDPEFEDKTTTYERKITLGLRNLISTMSEIVIGISGKKFAIINMNLSDSIYDHDELNSFVTKSLIPKIYAPIKPPVLSRFIQGKFDSENNEYANKLAELGKTMRDTDLFPEGSKFSEKVKRQSHRDVVNKILDGRTGVSYGFIALAEEPKYAGKKTVTKNDWETLNPIKGIPEGDLRATEKDRWYVKTQLNGKEVYQQVPDIWIVTSRSGCDKTNLNPKTDIVRIGLIKGKLYLEIPEGIDLTRRDIRPSFDTYVILAQAISMALYKPEVIKDGMPILHFHGYPDPNWFGQNEFHAGATNPSLPCGTVEAAILNYSAIYELANNNTDNASLLCLVESDHGVNILGPDKEYIVERLKSGKASGEIVLGGKFLPSLKENTASKQ